ncbi:MAG TPA: hypothetical protein VGD58_08020, partial [Herpetosiphonaceae bacterium]
MSARRHAALHPRPHSPLLRRFSSRTIQLLLVVASFVSLSGFSTARSAFAAGETDVYIPVVSMPQPAPTGKSVRQPMFWNKQNDTSVQTAAQRASFVALPRVERSYRDTMRANGFTGKAVQYFLSNEVHGPGPYANSSASCDSSLTPHVNQVAYLKGDFCTYLHPNESWFLHNGAGKRLYSWSGGRVMYHMNP